MRDGRFEDQRPARDMLAAMREHRPHATYHDLERVLRAGRKRAKKLKQSSAVDFFDVALAEVRGHRAMIQARRASLPRLHFWHEYRKEGTR
jgi:hypothetical protein